MGAYVKALFAYLARGPEALNGSSSSSSQLLADNCSNSHTSQPAAAAAAAAADTNQELLLLNRNSQQQQQHQQSQQAAAGQSIQAIQIIREQAWKQPTGAGNNWSSTGQPSITSECQQERTLMRDYYAQYDMLVGLRIASTLTILFVVFILFVIYKTGCARPPVASTSTSAAEPNSTAGNSSPRAGGQPSSGQLGAA